MDPPRFSLQLALKLLAVALILKVTAGIVLGYRDYFPPNFDADFLHGRQAYFFGAYAGAFYAHLAAGPLTLLFGLVLLSDRFRARFPSHHRALGKLQCLLILLLLTPSGLWMAYYAAGSFVAAAGFAMLSLLTATCVALGWRRAVQRQFAAHRRWMTCCFLLLCSAVVIRVVGGFVAVTSVGVTWSYPVAAWLSWLVPLAAYEAYLAINHRKVRQRAGQLNAATSSVQRADSVTLSPPVLEIIARR
jgi:hypothetical protein